MRAPGVDGPGRVLVEVETGEDSTFSTGAGHDYDCQDGDFALDWDPAGSDGVGPILWMDQGTEPHVAVYTDVDEWVPH